MTRMVSRKEDMSPDGELQLWLQSDGDVIIGISSSFQQQPTTAPYVEFTTIHSGGGASPRTYQALRALFDAVVLDNKYGPEFRRSHSDKDVEETGFRIIHNSDLELLVKQAYIASAISPRKALDLLGIDIYDKDKWPLWMAPLFDNLSTTLEASDEEDEEETFYFDDDDTIEVEDGDAE